MNCLYRDQHILEIADLHSEVFCDACGQTAKWYPNGATPISMPVVAPAAQSTHTTQVHKGRSKLNR